MNLRSRKRAMSTGAAALTLLFVPMFVMPSVATAKTRPTHWVQRHPTLTGIGAGVATRHMLKVSAARKKARGQKLNWAERHPTMTGFGVGATTRHIIKKHTPQ